MARHATRASSGRCASLRLGEDVDGAKPFAVFS